MKQTGISPLGTCRSLLDLRLSGYFVRWPDIRFIPYDRGGWNVAGANRRSAFMLLKSSVKTKQ